MNRRTPRVVWRRSPSAGRLLIASAFGLVVLLAATLWAVAQSPGAPARPLAAAFATTGHAAFPLVAADEAGDVRIALAELGDHAVHHFTFMAGEFPVEFLAVWADDNVVRTALNACDICYRAKLGYRQEGAYVVCNNCGNRFPIAEIAAVSGGCNPVPLVARIDGQDLVIASAALVAGLAYFP